jgi:hypothetical protein
MHCFRHFAVHRFPPCPTPVPHGPSPLQLGARRRRQPPRWPLLPLAPEITRSVKHQQQQTGPLPAQVCASVRHAGGGGRARLAALSCPPGPCRCQLFYFYVFTNKLYIFASHQTKRKVEFHFFFWVCFVLVSIFARYVCSGSTGSLAAGVAGGASTRAGYAGVMIRSGAAAGTGFDFLNSFCVGVHSLSST